MTSPYSFTTNYEQRQLGALRRRQDAPAHLDFQPSLAWPSTGGISIGAGPNIEYVRATFSNYLPRSAAPPSLYPDGHQYLKG